MKKLIFILMVSIILSESKNTTITNKGNMIEYTFGSFNPTQKICLTKEKREEIQHQLNENILHLNLDQKLFRADDHVLFSWPLLLNDNSNDYGYHGISGFVDNNHNYNNNLLDYNCGNRTYDTNDYNHQGTDYFLWPFEWNKVDNNAVSVISASSGIIIGKSDGNYDKNCDGWDTDYSTEWNAVYIQNDDGSISWYGHMKNGSLTNKSFGDTVNAGEYLGIVASSGISTGPHLHFETYKDNTFDHLIDPYYGECNNYNDDSWWIEQRPYYDSAINKIMTHSRSPKFYWDDCAKPANINAENHFTPNNYIYFGAYYRDQLSSQVSKWSLIDPEGNLYDSWEETLEGVDHYSASYSWHNYWFNNTVIKGEWTFLIYYNEKQYEHKFLICDNNSNPHNACDCDGNVLDCAGVCGGDDSSCYGIIKVPADYSTIQAGIDAAEDGDIVVVYPEIYYENIELNKTITITSLALFDTTTNTIKDSLDQWYGWVDGNWQVTDSLILNTIIDGSSKDSSTIIIAGSSCITPRVLGFTIQGGQGTEMERFYEDPEGGTVTVKQHIGGGILSFKSNPKIHYNIIQNNGLTGDIETGGAIYAASSGEDCDFSSRRSKLNETCDNDSYDFRYNFFEHNKSKLGMHLANRKFDGEFDLSGGVFDYWNCQNPEYQTKCWVNIDEIEDLTADDYASNSCLRSEDTYVDPEFGNDELNTGSADSPFLTIGKAVVSVAGSEFAPVAINLIEGIYSPSTNSEIFPINMISHVNLIGQGEEVTILDAEGSEENIRQVILMEDSYNNTLNKLTITGGYCLDIGNTSCMGGGIDLEHSELTLINVIISENTTDNCGGGVSLISSVLNTLYTKITKNISFLSPVSNAGYGGGICAHESYLELVDTDISSNQATAGGGIYLFESNFNLFSVSIINNQAIGCCWAGNEGGGGINIADDWAGDDVSFKFDSKAQYVTIARNYSDHRGGGIASHAAGTLSLVGVTIVDNISDRDGGGIFLYSQKLILKNSIVKKNYSPYQPTDISYYIDPNYMNNFITYSNIEGDLEGIGNIDTDPMFMNPDNGDYSLQEGSPCIDAGDPSPWYFDADSTIADMGSKGTASLAISFDKYDFGELYQQGGNVEWKLNNYGEESVIIDSVSFNTDQFLTYIAFPYVIESFEMGSIPLHCLPSSTGLIEDTMYVYIKENNHNPYVSLSATILEGYILEGYISGFLPRQDYTVMDFLYVDQGEELIIEAGARLLFKGNYPFNIQGTLKAIGTHDDSIIFKNYDNHTNEKWHGINFWHMYQQPNYSVLEYVKVLDSDMEGIRLNYSNGIIFKHMSIIGNKFSGLHLRSADLDINNIEIINNGIGKSGLKGGGIYMENSNPNINNVQIDGNGSTVSYAGGGIYMENSNPIITNVQISENASASGSGMYIINSNPILRDLEIYDNEGGNGGGMYLESSNPSIEKTRLQKNITDNNGGGIYLKNSNPILKYVIITDNNTIIEGSSGAGIFLFDSNPSLINVTISNNISDTSAGIALSSSNPTIINSIIQNNYPNGIKVFNSTPLIKFSDIYKLDLSWDQGGNIDTSPLFTDPINGDYSLQDSSPCIDAGIAFYELDEDTLINMNSDEYYGSAPDMGAFEWYPDSLSISDVLIPSKYHIEPAYPNPFNPISTIKFTLPNNANVKLIVYDIRGRQMETLINEFQTSGYHTISWNASSYPSGVYLIRMESDEFTQTQKVVLVK